LGALLEGARMTDALAHQTLSIPPADSVVFAPRGGVDAESRSHIRAAERNAVERRAPQFGVGSASRRSAGSGRRPVHQNVNTTSSFFCRSWGVFIALGVVLFMTGSRV